MCGEGAQQHVELLSPMKGRSHAMLIYTNNPSLPPLTPLYPPPMQVVEDMDADARFASNFFVCDPAFHLKFYVAAPLISSNGHRLGTL